MGIGGAAQKTQQSYVIDLQQLLRAEPQSFAQPHREHTRLKRLLHRLAHPEVNRQ